MDLIAIDAETHYEQGGYSLSKMGAREYIMDTRYQTIGVAYARPDGTSEWFTGTEQETGEWLRGLTDWSKTALVAHNTRFDGGILRWRFGINPALYMDTMALAKVFVRPYTGRSSLAVTAKTLGLGIKGTEVVNANGLRREDFSEEHLRRYGEYCVNDAKLCLAIARKLAPALPAYEHQAIDQVLRMYLFPQLELRKDILAEHLVAVEKERARQLGVALFTAGAKVEDLMSNAKFAKMLESMSVPIPMKTSPRTGKRTFAFAKKDKAFADLLDHPDGRVAALVEARMGIKSTQEVTRTKRLLDLAGADKRLFVPLVYHGAHSGRFSGDESINLQNPKRNSPIRAAIVAPEGFVVVVVDASQIELRINAYDSEQNDLVAILKDPKRDPYKGYAAHQIFGVHEDEVTEEQRTIGKVSRLSLQYGSWAETFQGMLYGYGVVATVDECVGYCRAYRASHAAICMQWKRADAVVDFMLKRAQGLNSIAGCKVQGNMIIRPSGVPLIYPNLRELPSDNSHRNIIYGPSSRPRSIYGAKVIENITQGKAGDHVKEVMVRTAKEARAALQVHDDLTWVVPANEADDFLKFAIAEMSRSPSWCQGLVLAAKGGYGDSYLTAKP